MVINVASEKKQYKTKFGSILNRIGKILSYAVIVVLICCALFFAYYFLSNTMYRKNPNSTLPRFGLYTIISPSMEPKIKVYDTVVTMTVDPKTIKIGDVISFISSSSISRGLLVTHRVINITTGSNDELAFQTKGDNNLTADTSMAMASSVIGKVIFKIPQLGRIQFFIAQKSGWLMIVVLPALGVIVYDFIKLFKLLGVNEKMEKLGIIEKNVKGKIDIDDLENLNNTYKKIKKSNNKKKTTVKRKK